MDKSRSRFALALQDLGFAIVPGADKESHVRTVTKKIEETNGKLTRNERRNLRKFIEKKLREQPSYTTTVFPDGVTITEASDDKGQMWSIKGNVDLRPFGFLNNAEWISNHLQSKKATSH